MNRILVVTNAAAGTNEQEAVDAALDVLRKGAEVEVAETSTPDELDEVIAGLRRPHGRRLRRRRHAARGGQRARPRRTSSAPPTSA